MPARRPPASAIATLLWTMLLVLALGSSADAAFETGAPRAILIDAASGAVLFEKDADTLAPPASMSKLMTLALLFREMKAGRVTPETEFPVSEHAWRTGGGPSGTAAMFASLNTKIPVSDLLQGIIVQSGNDASIIVAEGLGGSEDAFAQMMTAHARELGLSKSTFGNATGLAHPNQLMTARELALLGQHIIREYPDYYRMFAQRNFDYKRYKFYNRNPLLSAENGVDGLKTGFIDDAGYGIVGSAVRDGRRLIVVIMGAKTEEERKSEAKKLLDWGFKSFKEVAIFDAGEIVGDARVWGGSRYFVPLVGDGPVRILVPRSAKKNRLKATIVYQWPLKPPIRKGQRIATLRVEHAEAGINEVPLVAAEDVEVASVIARGIDSLMIKSVSWIPSFKELQLP